MNFYKVGRVVAVVAMAWLLGGLTACNTVEGAGEDLEAAGDAVEDATDDAAN